jgi:hypothetical protein
VTSVTFAVAAALLPALLVGCGDDASAPDPASQPAALSPAGDRLVRYSFTDLGASRSETKCAVTAFVERIGVPELNAAAEEFMNGDTDRFMAHRLDVALVAEECDVDDHRQVADCHRPHGEDERRLCQIAREGPSALREN